MCGRLIAGIAGSNIAEEGCSCLVCCVCSGLCDELIIRLAEPYRVCVFVYVRECLCI